MAVLMVNQGLSTVVGLLGGDRSPASRSGCSTGCCSPGSACRRSCSRSPGCSASRACCSTCSATTARSTCPADSYLLEFTRFQLRDRAGRRTSSSLLDRAGVYLALAVAARPRSRKAAELAPPWWPLVAWSRRSCSPWRPRVPHLLRQHRPRLQLPVVAVLRAGRGGRLRAAPHRLGSARVRGRRQRRGGPTLRHQGQPGLRVGVRADLDCWPRSAASLGAGLQTSVSQATGTTDTNLTAIAAAVIGGTSLFGGRGSAYAALLGILVLQAITSGLNLAGVESEVRFMVTGAVLLHRGGHRLGVAAGPVVQRTRLATRTLAPARPGTVSTGSRGGGSVPFAERSRGQISAAGAWAGAGSRPRGTRPRRR